MFVTFVIGSWQMSTHRDALFQLFAQHAHRKLNDLVRVRWHIQEVRLLVAHRRRILNAPQHALEVRQRPQTQQTHAQAGLVVHVRIAGHLRLLVVEQCLADQRVRARHLRRREAGRVELAGARQDHLAALGVALQQRHQVALLEDLGDRLVFAVQLGEPLRVQLPNGQVALQHLAGTGHGELLGAQEAQQEHRIGATALDVRMLSDPLAELHQCLAADVFVLAQFVERHGAEFRAESARVRVDVVGLGAQLVHGNRFGFQHCQVKNKSCLVSYSF